MSGRGDCSYDVHTCHIYFHHLEESVGFVARTRSNKCGAGRKKVGDEKFFRRIEIEIFVKSFYLFTAR